MDLKKINIGNSQEEKIVTSELKINKNVFIYQETMIPLCNISRVHTVRAKKQPYGIGWLIAVLIGFFVLSASDEIGLWGVIIGGLLVIGGAMQIYFTYKKNLNLGEYLVLNLNSGMNIYLYSKNHDFCIEVMDVIINCLNSGKEYSINMDNCKIEACQFGDHNMLRGKEVKNEN